MKTPMEILPEFTARTWWNDHSEKVLLSLFIYSREDYSPDEFRRFLEEQATQEETYNVVDDDMLEQDDDEF